MLRLFFPADRYPTQVERKVYNNNVESRVYVVNYVNDTACILLTLLTLTLFLQNLRLRELRRNDFGSQFSNYKRQKLLKTIFHSSANNEHFSPQNHTALFSA